MMMNPNPKSRLDMSVSADLREEEEEVRNWVELPRDVMSLIFIKLGAIDVLISAQSVCCTWRKLSKEPQIYRSIDMRDRWDLFDGEYDMVKIAKEAVERSSGQLVEFSMEHFGTDDLLQHIADKSSMLRSLRLVSCYQIYDDPMIDAIKKVPLLEELQLCHCSFSIEVIEAVGRFCPRLKSFRLNYQGIRSPGLVCDEEAITIAENMHELRHLHLFGNRLTDNGVEAILDGCPHLESLDLRQCFCVNLGGGLQKRCADRIRNLRLPDDSIHDYEFDARINGGFGSNFGSFDEDYPSGFSEIDFLSDDAYYEFSEGSYLSDYEDFGF